MNQELREELDRVGAKDIDDFQHSVCLPRTGKMDSATREALDNALECVDAYDGRDNDPEEEDY